MAAQASIVRGRVRSISAAILLAYVITHFANHICLLISVAFADAAYDYLTGLWHGPVGTAVLAAGFLAHYGNALWSIYVRRSFRLSRWGWWQLGLGLFIPVAIASHLASTRLGEVALGTYSDYSNILLRQWVLVPWKGVFQVALVSVVWTHAAIGIHFWLRTKRWYPRWRPALVVFAVIWPTLALAGYVAGGSALVRAATQSGFAAGELARGHVDAAAAAWADWAAILIVAVHLGLIGLAILARWVRELADARVRPVTLRHVSGRIMPVARGATVLETLVEHGVPHAAVCGGRARCTTCRVRVTEGLVALPAPLPLEARALERIGAPADCRLACQMRPTADVAIVPMLPANASPEDGRTPAGFAGHEQLVTVMFVDLRGSTKLGEARLPYDVLFLLDQVFGEMSAALKATGGHFSQFTGDGLMAIYGMEGGDPAAGAQAALAGARDMLARLDRLNQHLLADLKQPLRIGIGIHHGVAIVGPLGPPGSRIVTAIGDTVNTTARLEGLSKQHDGAVIISRVCAEAARADLADALLHIASVAGRAEPVEYYALS